MKDDTMYWKLVFIYYKIKSKMKREKKTWLTLVCPDCLLPLSITTDIDYINYGTCRECKQVRWVGYPQEFKPIARVVTN